MDRLHADNEAATGVRFGRTLIVPVTGTVLEQQVQAIACPANRRGVMGAGIAGQLRMAGGIDIEREAMAKAPLTLGAAISTSAGSLSDRGVTTIIHAVVSDALGTPTRVDIVRSATSAALTEADRCRVRSLLLPPLGSGLGPGRLPSGTVAVAMIEEIVAHLRRFTCRLDRIVLAHDDAREANDILHALREARELWWGLKV
jgi:O-acetyl-ADP-ribose deacetylase (regulator of RNase III)